jgi:hypothetical protein
MNREEARAHKKKETHIQNPLSHMSNGGGAGHICHSMGKAWWYMTGDDMVDDDGVKAPCECLGPGKNARRMVRESSLLADCC